MLSRDNASSFFDGPVHLRQSRARSCPCYKSAPLVLPAVCPSFLSVSMCMLSCCEMLVLLSGLVKSASVANT